MTDTDSQIGATEKLTIRRVMPGDAEAVAALSGQLGYKASAEEMRQRIEKLSRSEEAQAAFVACLSTGKESSCESRVAGWIEVAIVHHLQSPPFALIGGLVIDENFRGRHIGKRLCEEVEAWTRAQGISVLQVTSRSTRADAHRFYLRDGFKQTKLSHVFEKLLTD